MLLPSHNHPSRFMRHRHQPEEMRLTAFLAVGGLAAGLLAGCAAPAAPSAQIEKPAAPVAAGVAYAPVALDPLKKGMTTAEVIALWDQPAEKRPLQTPAGTADIWVYHHVIRSYQRQVATSIQLVPVFDSFTNGTKNVPEAVYSQERVQIIRTSELLIFKDRLIEWKVSEESTKLLLN